MEFNQSFKAPSIPKLSKKNISSSVLRVSSAASSSSNTLESKSKITKFSFRPFSSKLNEKIETINQPISEALKPTEQSKNNNSDVQGALVETNRILVEIQKQLALDFAMRIAEEKQSLKKIKASEAKRKVFDKEKFVEGGKKLVDTGKNIVNKLTQPVKSIFDKIKEFFGLILTKVLLGEAFKWLRDPNNRKLLDGIFYWIGKAFIPAVIAIIGYKVFKWVKRLWMIGKFLWKLPGRLIGVIGKLLTALGLKGAPAATSAASAATSAAVKASTSSAYAATKAGKAYAGMQAQRNLPKWAQKAAGGSASRFAASNERIIQGTANLGDKLRVGSRMKGMPGIGQIAEGFSGGVKGIFGKAGGAISGFGDSITTKFVSPIIDVVLPKVPPKVRQKVAGAVASKGLKRFLPFVNTLFGTVEGASRLFKGDIEGALISFASAIPVVGWGALALDIYRSVDPEGYKKNIRMGMTTEDMNAAISQGFGSIGTGMSAAGMATGGTVPGSGSGKVDSVKTMLAPGEEVINTSSAMLFRPLLKDINDNSGRLWTTFSKAVRKLSATSEYQKDVSEEYSKVIDEFNENIKKSIDKKKKPRPNPNPSPPVTTTPPPTPSLPPPATPTTSIPEKDKEKKDDKPAALSGGSITPVQPKDQPGASVTPGGGSSMSGVIPPDTSGAGGMNFLQMNLPDAGGVPRIPQPPSQATDVSVIAPFNPINPYMNVTPGWYGIHMR